MTKNGFQKKTKINSLATLLFAKINNNSFILFKFQNTLTSYLQVPIFIQCILKKKDLLFNTESLTTSQVFQYHQFISQFQDYLKRVQKPFKKKLLLKGLGYKAILKDDEASLELKIGYSHTISLSIEKEVLKVILDKNTLTVEGFDKVKVGNFVDKIRSLKFPDSYKGKGFWYKNEVIKLKEINKT